MTCAVTPRLRSYVGHARVFTAHVIARVISRRRRHRHRHRTPLPRVRKSKQASVRRRCVRGEEIETNDGRDDATRAVCSGASRARAPPHTPSVGAAADSVRRRRHRLRASRREGKGGHARGRCRAGCILARLRHAAQRRRDRSAVLNRRPRRCTPRGRCARPLQPDGAKAMFKEMLTLVALMGDDMRRTLKPFRPRKTDQPGDDPSERIGEEVSLSEKGAVAIESLAELSGFREESNGAWAPTSKKEAAQLFNKLLNELLTSFGLQRREQEACIYKYFDADGRVLIGCEVDDLIVTGTNEKKIAELQKVFKDKWNVEQWSDIHTFLGMRSQYNRSEGGLKFDVEQNIKDMLKRFPELAKLPYKTVPLQPSQVNKELKVGDIKPLTAIDEYLIKEYPKIIGAMMHIAITARPDIAYAVGKLSRGMHQPSKLHCDMLKDVIGYLQNTIPLPLRFTRKLSKISFLFAELKSGDAVLSELHSHSFVEASF